MVRVYLQWAFTMAAISAAKDMRGMPLRPQPFNQRNNSWGFARTTCIYIANADHRDRGGHPLPLCQTPPCAKGIKRRQRRKKPRAQA